MVLDQDAPENISDNHLCVNIQEVLETQFASRDELLRKAKAFYANKGYVLVIKNSRKDKYVVVGCDRGGKYRDRHHVPLEQRQRITSSRLINCPFEIQGKRQIDGLWKLIVKDDTHNHDASSNLVGHPGARTLSHEEKKSIDEMSKSGIEPRQILSSLRQKNPEIQVIAQDIYNIRKKVATESLDGRSRIQALFEELSKADFTFEMKQDDEGHLTHLFFAHSASIKLSRSYSTIFVMDCTYKTNKYNMPLLEVIGITSFNTSFYSCFVFLLKEGFEDYEWALTVFSRILGPESQPSVIITDRELALMKAIREVFPASKNLLCVWHIQKNIVSSCKSHFQNKEEWDNFVEAWNKVIYSQTERAYMDALHALEVDYSEKAGVLNYIRRTWIPYKEYFVAAWTDNMLHFRNHVTSRAEGAHSKLKQYLLVSTGDIRKVKDRMCRLIENEIQEIKAQFERERIHILHKCDNSFFKEVVTKVSIFALSELAKQFEMVKDSSVQPLCSGKFLTTMGLPCAHVMRGLNRNILPLESIHSQWRIDTRVSLFTSDANYVVENKLDRLLSKFHEKFPEWPLVQKRNAEEKLSELVDEIPLLSEPIVQRGRGRPSMGRKRRATSSTRRDPSQFEIVEASLRQRNRHGVCSEIGQNGASTSMVVQSSNSFDDALQMTLMDLNMFPDMTDAFMWN